MVVIGQIFLIHLPITSNLCHRKNISIIPLLVIGNNPIKFGSLRILGNMGHNILQKMHEKMAHMKTRLKEDKIC